MSDSMINEFDGDPRVVDSNEKYWFWDEIWTEKQGPFDTLEICTEYLNKYVRELELIKEV